MKMLRNKKWSTIGNSFKKQRILVSAFLLILICSMSFGYALYYTELSLAGDITLVDTAGIKPVNLNVKETNTTPGDSSYHRTYNDTSTNVVVNFKGTFNSYSFIEYDLKVTNYSSFQTYYYDGLTYSGELRNNSGNTQHMIAPLISGIKAGDAILPGESKTITFRYLYFGYLNGSYNYDNETIFRFVTDLSSVTIPSLATTLGTTEFQLDQDTLSGTTLHVLNLYDSSVGFKLKAENNQVEIIDQNGNLSDYQSLLDTNGETDINFYIRVKDGVEDYESMTSDLYLELNDGSKQKIDTVTLYEPEKRITIKPTRATVTTDCQRFEYWADHWSCYFTVRNIGDTRIEQWTLEMKLNSSMNVTTIQNWNDEWSYDKNTKTFKISSDGRYTSQHNSINPGGYYTTQQFIVEMTNNQFLVDKYTLYADGETDIYTDNFSANGRYW